MEVSVTSNASTLTTFHTGRLGSQGGHSRPGATCKKHSVLTTARLEDGHTSRWRRERLCRSKPRMHCSRSMHCSMHRVLHYSMPPNSIARASSGLHQHLGTACIFRSISSTGPSALWRSLWRLRIGSPRATRRASSERESVPLF